MNDRDEFGGILVEDKPEEKDEFGGVLVEEPTTGKDLFEAELSAAPQKPSPGLLRMLGRSAAAPFEAAKRGLDLPLMTDYELKDYLERKFLESKGEKEPTTMGKVGGFIGNLVGSIGLAVTGGQAGPPGMTAAFASQGGHDAFVRAGVRALSEGKSIDEALNIAKGIGPIGAVVGATTAAAFPGKVPVTLKQTAISGLPAATVSGAGTLIENLAERELGLKTPIAEGVPETVLTMAALPPGMRLGKMGLRAGLRRLRRALPEPQTPITERTPDAIQRETEEVLRTLRTQSGPGVREVPTEAPSAEVVTRGGEIAAEVGEQPARPAGAPALGDVAKALNELQSTLADPTKPLDTDTAVKLGQQFKTPEDIASLRQWHDNALVQLQYQRAQPGLTLGQRARLAKADSFVKEALQSAEKAPERPAVSALKAEAAPEPAKPTVPAPTAKPTIPAELDKVIKELTPQKPKGWIWLFHGEGGPEGGGTGQAYWTTKPELALSYGPKISAVAIPAKEAAKYATKMKEEYVIPAEWINRSAELGTFEQPTHVLETAVPEAPKAAVPTEAPKPTPEPAKPAEPVPGTAEARMKRLDELHSLLDRGQLTPEQEAEMNALESAARTKITEAPEPAEVSVGPGAASPSDITSSQSEMQQLTQVVEGAASPKKTVAQRVEDAKQAVRNFRTEGIRNIGEMAANGVKRLVAMATSLKTGLTKLPEFTTFKKILGEWDGANQAADHELMQFVRSINRSIPADRQIAITNYIQAEGDNAVLQQRAAASKTPQLRKGYEDAQKLNRDEKIVADQLRMYLDDRLQKGIAEGILDHGIENYITQIWKKVNPVTDQLKADVGTGKMQQSFRYARKRLFDSYFEGEQLGYIPGNKSVGALIAAYDQAFNRSVAARAFIKNLTEGRASDGRPLVVPDGNGIPVGGIGSEALLVKQHIRTEETADYLPFDHPALKKWKWVGQVGGGDVLYQGNLLVHPEVFNHLTNVLKKSKWKQIPLTREVLQVERGIKELMFTLSLFHQTQETLHAIGHRVNPANLEKVDLREGWQKEGVEHGLEVSSYNALEQFSEGLGTGPLINKIPLIGKRFLGPYSEWLFQDYIPRLKITMYKHALERNLERFKGEMDAGKINRDQVVELTAGQANAAFGELNYKWMGRNPTLQDALRTFLIAPDFLEARGRFVGQAIKPYGREQLVALGYLAAAQYVAARVLNYVLDDDPHFEPENAFKLIHGKHSYELRTVPGDIVHLFARPHQFVTARASPVVRTAIEGFTGRDWRGIQRDALDQVKDFLRLPTPISLRREDDQKFWQPFLNAFGVHERSYTAGQEISDLAKKYRESVKGKPIVELLESADSPYRKMKSALDIGNEKAALESLNELRKTRKDEVILKSMKQHLDAPFTGLSHSEEMKFKRTLTKPQLAKYQEALVERKERYDKFKQIWLKRGPRPAPVGLQVSTPTPTQATETEDITE